MLVSASPEAEVPENVYKQLEQLSEELVQIFNYDNIDNSTVHQKEELIQKIIKLGGKDYTAEDL